MNMNLQNNDNFDVPDMSNIGQDDNLTMTNDSSKKLANSSRKAGKFKRYKMKVANRGFKLIDKRFKQQIEIMPGVISQNRPIAGTVRVNINVQAQVFEKAIKMVLDKWSLGVGYHEVRALKGLNGLGGSYTDDECLQHTAKVLTTCLVSLINIAFNTENFGIYLQNLGLGKLMLPTLFMDVLKLVISYKRLHNPQFLENSSIFFEINELNTIDTRSEEEWKQEYALVHKKFGQENTPFIKVFNYLSRFSQLTSLMSTDSTDVLELSVLSSNHVFNVLTEFNENDDCCLKMGQGANLTDILLSTIINVDVKETDLSEYHLDYYYYVVPREKWIVGLKRSILSSYCNIEDTFVSPTTTSQSKDILKADVSGITAV